MPAGWDAADGEFPWPPQNVQVMSPLIQGALDLRWDDPSLYAIGDGTCGGYSNSQWTIIGVNIYRSDDGERGPYRRINQFPIGALQYRDATDNMPVSEIVHWDNDWVSQGDSSNDRTWVFRTKKHPIVKQSGQAVAANSPADVTLTIDGVIVPVASVFGPRGEITLVNTQIWNPATEKLIEPTLPTAASSVVITYWYNRNLVRGNLDRQRKRFYRLTTVAEAPVGVSTPSGLVETPLEYSPPVTPYAVESMDYIWREAVRRNNWILEQGGERVKLFVRKTVGIACGCSLDDRNQEYNHQPRNRCEDCFGTGFIAGYNGPFDIILAPDDGEHRVEQTDRGRVFRHSYSTWTGPSPAISQRDFIVKQTGERYSIGAITLPTNRGNILQQHFDVGALAHEDIRYGVTPQRLNALENPETRPTVAKNQCNTEAPYPVGSDRQATPMTTEKGNIPDAREQRGRTPVWENITW